MRFCTQGLRRVFATCSGSIPMGYTPSDMKRLLSSMPRGEHSTSSTRLRAWNRGGHGTFDGFRELENENNKMRTRKKNVLIIYRGRTKKNRRRFRRFLKIYRQVYTPYEENKKTVSRACSAGNILWGILHPGCCGPTRVAAATAATTTTIPNTHHRHHHHQQQQQPLLRGTIVNRTYGIHKNLDI